MIPPLVLGLYDKNSTVRCTLRVTLQVEACPFKLEIQRYWSWPENPGDLAWRRRVSRCFYPRNLVQKRDNTVCDFIISVVLRVWDEIPSGTRFSQESM